MYVIHQNSFTIQSCSIFHKRDQKVISIVAVLIAQIGAHQQVYSHEQQQKVMIQRHRRRGASGSGGSSAGLLPEKYALGGGTIEWPNATSRGAKRRAGRGSGGVTPGKILKFETQFGAFWRQIGGETMSMTRKVTHNRGATVAKQVYSLSGGVDGPSSGE